MVTSPWVDPLHALFISVQITRPRGEERRRMRSKRGEGSRVGVVSVLSRVAGRGEDGEMMENEGRWGTLKGERKEKGGGGILKE